LAVAAFGGWLGYNHGNSVDQSLKAAHKPDQAGAISYTVGDTTRDAAIGFFATEFVVGLGLIGLERRYLLNHPELHPETPKASV